MDPLTIFIIVFLIITVWIIFTFNSFINLNNRTNEAWSDIDVQLKRKYDLIPKLIDLVKGYSKHEKSLFTNLAEVRTKALQTESISKKGETDLTIHLNLAKLLAVAENYPKLRASENFLELQKELKNTEDIIAYARRFYNGNVRDLNIKIESFPNNFLASIFNIKKRDFFQAEIKD